METKTKPNWILRSCPRCRGDMFREDNSYECLQCGFIKWDYARYLGLNQKNNNGGKQWETG